MKDKNTMTSFNISLKSIQLKIALWTGCCLLLVAAAIIAYAALALRNTAIEAAQATEIAAAQAQAGIVDAEIAVALDAARTLAQALSSIKDEEHRVYLSRDDANAILRQVLLDNPQFLGTYTLWEPNAFDGHDAGYANTEGHDSTGRFIAYWNRNKQEEIRLETPMDYETEGVGDYYQCPKRTKQECITDPYIYPVMVRRS
jgi:methyl-accepting chemotaxis protein